MKKIVFIYLLIFSLLFAGCVHNKETIEGYWMTENGETISFTSNGEAISNGQTANYSIYGDNNLSISRFGSASQFRFEINNDTLTLVDLDNNAKNVFYRNEEKQREIQIKLNERKKQEEALEKKQQQLAKEKEEHDKYIKSLKSDISNVEIQIETLEGFIKTNEDIIGWHQSDIQDFSKEPEIYDKEFIDKYRQEIVQLKNDITGYRQEITELKKEKEELQKLLDDALK